MEGNSLTQPCLSWEPESEGRASWAAGPGGWFQDPPLGIEPSLSRRAAGSQACLHAVLDALTPADRAPLPTQMFLTSRVQQLMPLWASLSALLWCSPALGLLQMFHALSLLPSQLQVGHLLRQSVTAFCHSRPSSALEPPFCYTACLLWCWLR